MAFLASSPRLRRALDASRDALNDRDFYRELAPLAVALAVAPWLFICIGHYSLAGVFRDSGMFSYAAWCLLHGVRIYKDIATPDGPLVYIVHAMLQLLGGTSDQGLRRVDLLFHAVLAMTITLLVTPRAPRLVWVRRVVWAVVGASFWMSRLVEFSFGATLQREGYYVGLGLLGLALVYASSDRATVRSAKWMLCAGGFFAGWVMFGKHTGLLYAPAVVLGAYLLPDDTDQPRWWRVRWAATGVGLAIASAFLFIAIFGSVPGFFYWYFKYNWVYYRFHEPVFYADLLANDGLRNFMFQVAVATAAGLAAVLAGVLPRRAGAFVIVPLLNLTGSIAQRKGWTYHFIPPSFSVGFLCVVALAYVWGTTSVKDELQRVRTAGAVALLGFIAFASFRQLQESPWMHRSEEHLDDPAVTQPKEIARYLREHTHDDDRVYHFGDDPEVVFLAGRKPASPYHVAWTLELTNWPREGELAPTPAQQANLAAMQQQLHDDLCARLTAEHPAALVLKDGSVGKPGKGTDYLFAACPAYKGILEREYHDHPMAPYHIYLRNDRP